MDRVQLIVDDIFRGKSSVSPFGVDTMPIMVERIKSLITLMRSKGLCHGDFHPGNVGFVMHGSTARMVMLDFERSMIMIPGRNDSDRIGLLSEPSTRGMLIEHIDALFVWRYSMRKGKAFRAFNEELHEANFESSELLNPAFLESLDGEVERILRRYSKQKIGIDDLAGPRHTSDAVKTSALHDCISDILSEVFLYTQFPYLSLEFKKLMRDAFKQKMSEYPWVIQEMNSMRIYMPALTGPPGWHEQS
jgi:hypothetical protein